MLVPEVVVNKDGDWVTPVMKDEGNIRYFVVFRFINGSEIIEPKDKDYEKLGSLMRMFHEKQMKYLKVCRKLGEVMKDLYIARKR